MQEELVQEHFRNVLRPEELRRHVQLAALTSLQAAAAEADVAFIPCLGKLPAWVKLSMQSQSQLMDLWVQGMLPGQGDHGFLQVKLQEELLEELNTAPVLVDGSQRALGSTHEQHPCEHQ
ncbi:hypothetical protein MHYP_G00356810 [Metynnis hypsauchen]